MVFETEIANSKSAILSQGIIVLILFVFGMMGNGILLVAYWRDYRMQTTTNMLVISHISAEFSFAINGILVYGSSLIRLEVLGGNLCIFAGTVNLFLFFVSILSLAAIAVDRYFAVVKRSHHKFTKKVVKRVIIFIWSQAVVSAIPWDLILIKQPGKRFIAWVLGNCEKYLTLREHHYVPILTLRVVLWILSFFVPCCIIFYASVRILRSAIHKRARVHVLEYPRNPADAYMKSAFTTIMIIAVYFLCLTPSMVLYVFREGSSSYYSLTLHSIAKVAMSFRSVCYPVIFIARNRKFSGYVKSFFEKKFRYLRWAYSAMCCRPQDRGLGIGTSNVYICPPNPKHCSTCNINRLYERKTMPFRGKPVKLAFTDLNDL